MRRPEPCRARRPCVRASARSRVSAAIPRGLPECLSWASRRSSAAYGARPRASPGEPFHSTSRLRRGRFRPQAVIDRDGDQAAGGCREEHPAQPRPREPQTARSSSPVPAPTPARDMPPGNCARARNSVAASVFGPQGPVGCTIAHGHRSSVIVRTRGAIQFFVHLG